MNSTFSKHEKLCPTSQYLNNSPTDNSPNRQFPNWQFPDRQFPDRTTPWWTIPNPDFSPTGQLPDQVISRKNMTQIEIHIFTIILKKDLVGELSGRGKVWVGKCPFGELSDRGIAGSGNCPSGNFLFGKLSVRELSGNQLAYEFNFLNDPAGRQSKNSLVPVK